MGDGQSWLLGAAREFRKDHLGTYERAMLRHGGRPVRFRVGPPHFGFEFHGVFSPEGARQVLATDNACYDKEAPAVEEFRWMMGDGLGTSEGDRWRRDRRTIAPLFTKRQVGSYVAPIAAAADRLVDSWAPISRRGGCVDLNEAGLHFALDVLGETVFGDDVEKLAPVLRATVPLLNEFVAHRALSPIRLPVWLPTPANRRAQRARLVLRELVENLISERRPESADRGDLLSLLVAASDPETGEALDDVSVRDQALAFLVVGHETTATTLALALHLLGHHHAVQQRVRDEIEATVADRPISAADIEQLRFTGQVVEEALRLYPSGHAIVRRACEAVTISGHPVPQGGIVVVSVWGIHHNPAVWKDPNRFDPDRFGSDPTEAAAKDSTRYAHLPFGGGPRGCIGQHLAMAELVVALAAVVRAYRLESIGVAKIEAGVSVRAAGKLPCRLRPA